MPILPAGTPRHLVNAAAGAYYNAAGQPAGLVFNFGTWKCPILNTENWGIIKNCEVKSIGDASSLKDEGNATFLHHLADPGWTLTGTLLHKGNDEVTTPTSPQRMGTIYFSEVFERNRGKRVAGGIQTGPNGIQPLKAVVMELTFKYEQGGWQEFSFTAEARDSMQDVATFGAHVEAAGIVIVPLISDDPVEP